MAGVGRDRAIRNFALNVVAIDPPAAIRWAGEIGDENRKSNSVRRVAEKWANQDHQAAERWLRGQGYSNDWVISVLENAR